MKERTLVLESVDQLYLGPTEMYMLFYSGTQAEGAAPTRDTLMAEDRSTGD